MLKFITKTTVLLAILFIGNSAQAALPTQWGYIEVDGGKIFYQTFGSSGEPIIVLHGGPGLSQGYLLPQMLELDQKNKVTFYDQRGSGNSLQFNLTPETVNIKTFVKDLEIIRKKLGYQKFILAGHSFGGRIAMSYAIAYPKRLSALILFGSAPADGEGMKVFLTEYQKRTTPLKDKIEEIQGSEKFKQYDPKAVEEYLSTLFSVYFYPPENISKLSLQFTPGAARDGMIVAGLFDSQMTNYDLTPLLRSLKVPTLIVHGEYDIVPLTTAEKIHQSIPNSKFVVIKNCDHFPYIDQPKEFFAAINEFLVSLKL